MRGGSMLGVYFLKHGQKEFFAIRLTQVALFRFKSYRKHFSIMPIWTFGERPYTIFGEVVLFG